jgi:ATP-binding cassette, subfamily B, bacterial MsbA
LLPVKLVTLQLLSFIRRLMKSLRPIFRYLFKYPKLIAAYFSFNLLSAIFSVLSLGLVSPFLLLIFKDDSVKALRSNSSSGYNPINYFTDWLNTIINSGQDGRIKALGVICIVVLISFLLKNLFLYLSMYFLNPIRNNISNDIRNSMYRKILALPIGYFNEKRKGDIMSRLTHDLGDVEASSINILETIFREPLNILFFITYMFILSTHLTIFLLIFIPVSGLVIGRIGRSLKRQSHEVQSKLGMILSTIDETLSGLRIIKAFNAEDKQLKKFEDENSDLLVIKNRANRRRDLASPVSEVMGITAVTCILWYGGRLVLGGNFLPARDFLTYILIFSQLIQPLKALAGASYNLKKGAASIERIELLLNENVTIKDVENPVELKTFNNKIEFNNVGFAYDDKSVLGDINFTLAKGKTIALVGSSGSGKSTLADLLPRFHDVVTGNVKLDGTDLRQYSLRSLRHQMGIVTQEPILFNDTIANNIALGMDNATEEQIIQAAKIANAHDFIIQKENGYKTNIGDRGTKLSGGERQRITIARAVLKNPAILILDEATSSLDTESERLVQDAINKLMKDRTTLVIAHRLSTIRHSDEILVLKEGKVIERGTHESLISQEGFYRKLVEMQEVK